MEIFEKSREEKKNPVTTDMHTEILRTTLKKRSKFFLKMEVVDN